MAWKASIRFGRGGVRSLCRCLLARLPGRRHLAHARSVLVGVWRGRVGQLGARARVARMLVPDVTVPLSARSSA